MTMPSPFAPQVQPVNIVIGLMGGIGCGKTTVAGYLSHIMQAHHASFAGPLKGLVCATYLLEPSDYVTQEQKAEPILSCDGRTFRELCESFGTDCARQHNPDVWINHARRLMEVNGGGFVFEDLRFQNEADMIWDEYHGAVIEVQLVDKDGNPCVTERTGHESDEAWLSIEPDYLILSEKGDYSDLFGQAQEALDKIGLKRELAFITPKGNA